MEKIKVGVVGVSGYTGQELIRILTLHDSVEITEAYGLTSVGKRLHEIYPFINGINRDLVVKNFFESKLEADVYITCVPHGEAFSYVKRIVESGKRVIDLSADFRLKNVSLYEGIYGVKHDSPHLLDAAVFGMPELHRDEIKNAKIVSNPGCLARASILSLYPFFKEGLVDASAHVVIDVKTGISGAGRKPRSDLHFPEMNEDFRAYNPLIHRHIPEIKQELKPFNQNIEPEVLFVPHLIPVDRGIIATSYFKLKRKADEKQLQEALLKTFENEIFIRVLDSKQSPSPKRVRGTNYVEIAAYLKDDYAATIVALDNLSSGASGTAVHNLNIMFDLPEEAGLSKLTPLFP